MKNLHCRPRQKQCDWISWAPGLNWLWLTYRFLLLVFKTPEFLAFSCLIVEGDLFPIIVKEWLISNKY
jgi:hypothetical protein